MANGSSDNRESIHLDAIAVIPNNSFLNSSADNWGIIDGAVDHYKHPTEKKYELPAHRADTPLLVNTWEYPGWGSVSRPQLEPVEIPKKKLLDMYRATSIAGNDLMASVLYTIGITSVVAGPMAPISLLLICVFLWPYRTIYSEVGTALPLNGGSYNCILNATSKFTATFAASFSLISYTATAVVSAASATSYVSGEFGSFDVFWPTIGVLALFALLTLLGIRDSSNVAITIFALHMTTLCVLVISCVIFLVQDRGQLLAQNYINYESSDPVLSIYYGFSAGLLGITGFETSSNYIEQQRRGVFPRTMTNMWTLVTLFNPTIALLSIAVIPMETLVNSPNNALSVVGGAAGGHWLRIWIAVDAAIVLGGGVLTAFVGVGGLIERLASDRCLPQFLLRRNPFTHTYHFIILSFFTLTSTLYAIVDGNITSLSSVFAIAFLSVMCMFAVGNMLLKYKRPRLPRKISAHWFTVLIGFSAMFSGLVGNLVINPGVLEYFALYYFVSMSVVIITFARIRILKIVLYFTKKNRFLRGHLEPFLIRQIKKMKKLTVLFFTKTDEIHILNKAVHYAHSNELCDRIKICHVYEKEEDIPPHLEENHYILDHIYPKIQIDLVLIKGKFNPGTVRAISQYFGISPSFMFIRCPTDKFEYNIGEFGGVRTIMQ